MARLDDFVADLRRHFAGDIRLDPASKVLYSTDASIYQIEPLGVLLPRTQEDLHASVELAAKHKIPILPRGAGSSLAGQAIGEALILDCSRWLDNIIEIDSEGRRAIVEPGVVLSRLNREVSRYGLQFGPDPASAERATMGGVIGNNATGAHSIVYGMAADHLLSADVVMADGGLATLGPVSAEKAGQSAPAPAEAGSPVNGSGAPTRYEATVAVARDIRERYAAQIKNRFPRTWRNSAGYRLNYLIPWTSASPPEWGGDAYPPAPTERTFNAAHLLAGSEGTLAVMRRITVDLVPKPAHSVLGVLYYGREEEACDHVPGLLRHHPSAVELIPWTIIDLARRAPAYARQAGWVQTDDRAVLVVEFSGDSIESLHRQAQGLGSDVQIIESREDQAAVWGLRKAGLGLLDSRPRSERSVTFIEDCAIPVDKLGDFVRRTRRVMAEHQAEGGIYGHASAGCLHIRPILNLKTAGGVRALREIAEQTLEIALDLGGSMVSEHGDGIARGEWLRRTYGDEVAEALMLLKRAADPEGLLNPRKMLQAPPMDSQLRYGAGYYARTWTPGMDFSRNGDLETAIEQCNGQAVCRKDDGVMCPSFQATREEMHSTRGRANLLRALISTGLPGGGATPDARRTLSEATFNALDLCLGCKGCKSECPSGVDMAKLKSAFLEHFYESHSRRLREYAFGYFHRTARVLSALRPIGNAVNKLPPLRGAINAAVGIAPARPLPRFARPAKPKGARGGMRRVLFLRDPFTHFVDVEVEQAARQLLQAAGFDVLSLRAMGAGASMVSKGFLKSARRHAQNLLGEIAAADPTGSLPIVAIEPSELSTLRNDYADLVQGAATSALTRVVGALSVEELLVGSGFPDVLRVATNTHQLLYHPHCHQKADQKSADEDKSIVLLGRCGYEVTSIDAGCCGMAGTFGYEAEHYDLSQKIARLRLIPQIEASQIGAVAATGAACRMQIAQATNVAVAHPLVWAVRALYPNMAVHSGAI